MESIHRSSGIRKMIKAYYIFSTKETFPPKTHNLLKLSSLSGLMLEKRQELLFADVNRFNIAARYPDIKEDLYKIAGKDFTKKYLDEINESIQWIKSQIIL
jgi:HEPN domain-containing protein